MNGGSQRSGKNRNAGQYQKGQSGNPGGRPKDVGFIRELARKHTEKSIETLAAALDDEDGRVRIAAANSLLDRAWGRPHQEHEHSGGVSLILKVGGE